MPGIRSCRSALVLLVGALVVLPAAAYAQTAPARAAGRTAAGRAACDRARRPRAVRHADGHRAEDDGAGRAGPSSTSRTIQPQLAQAAAERDEAQTRWDQLTAHLVYLDGIRSRTIVELDAAKTRLGRARRARTRSRAAAGSMRRSKRCARPTTSST